jgi:hypothetical protein
LRKQLDDWAKDAVERLRDARPAIPDFLGNRAADVWEPLLAIADLAQGDWAREARKAASDLSGRPREESLGVQLLRDIRAILQSEQMSSEMLVQRLTAIEESPWGGYSKAWGPSLTAQALAKHLKPFDIQPQPMRIGGVQKKGYYKAALQDAWDRYLPAENITTVHRVNSGLEGLATVDDVDADEPPEQGRKVPV